MFGQNPIRKQELRPDGQLWVQEVFRTIQGEGPRAGQPAVFIRLSGCNLACKFCDTEFESGEWLSSEEVGLRAARLVPDVWLEQGRPLFVLTGGEPLRQDIRELAARLSMIGTVQIETAGTLWLDGLDPAVELVVSPKTGSVHAAVLARATAWKYILREGETALGDGLPNISPQTGVMQTLARRGISSAPVYVQPCDDHNPVLNRRNLQHTAAVALRFGYRMSLQQHKLLELP